MKIIVAQGNPGDNYAATRHNTGFMLIDAFAEKAGVTLSEKSKFHAFIAEVTIDGEKVLLVKPTTFYNETGLSARKIVDFYKLNPASDVLVIHDDIALPLGTIRTREKGSDAGNNGIKSLSAHLGEHYARVRVGVWSELADKMGATGFVLGRLTSDEKTVLEEQVQPRIEQIINDFAAGKFEITSHK